MSKKRKKIVKWKFLLLYYSILPIVTSLLITFSWAQGWRFNLSGSMPVGLYQLTPERPQRKDPVVFCLARDNPYSVLAAARGYLGAGSCPSGLKPLLKRLEGLAGDEFLAGESGIWLNGRLLANSAWQPEDSRGRPMPGSNLVWHRNLTIEPGWALVMSEGRELGFDSRYFGLVEEQPLLKAVGIFLF